MAHRTNRPRRTASRWQIQVLRLLGWRYSARREAWVHRVGQGRRGPVFSVFRPQDLGTLPEPDAALDAAIREARDRCDPTAPVLGATTHTRSVLVDQASADESEPPPLARRVPRRTAASRSGPEHREVTIDLGGDTVTVRVDGRPPAAPGRPHLAIAPTEATA